MGQSYGFESRFAQKFLAPPPTQSFKCTRKKIFYKTLKIFFSLFLVVSRRVLFHSPRISLSLSFYHPSLPLSLFYQLLLYLFDCFELRPFMASKTTSVCVQQQEKVELDWAPTFSSFTWELISNHGFKPSFGLRPRSPVF